MSAPAISSLLWFVVIAGCLANSIDAFAQGRRFVTGPRLSLGTESRRTASVRAGDVDGDSDTDLVMANGRHWPQKNMIFLNQQKGLFNVARPLGVDLCTSYACELADLDGDGEELYDHSDQREPVPRSNLGKMETSNIADSVEPAVLNHLRTMLYSTHPPRKLTMAPAVHTSPSGSGRLPVDLTFKNEADVEITVYPIQPTGRRARGRKLKPGGSVTVKARLGGAFVVESKDGTIHEIHSPSWPSRPVVIGR